MPVPLPPPATIPTHFHDWTLPGYFWWHSLSTSEQAAWAIVWATAVCGLLAAIGSFMAAWAAKSAASTAIEISQKDRAERQAVKEVEDSTANWRAALSLEPSIERLLELVNLAISALEEADRIPPDANGRRVAEFGSTEFNYMVDALAHEDIARIGNLAHVASGVSGRFGTVILQCLAWSREAAPLLEHVVTSQDLRFHSQVYTSYYIDFWYMDDALKACRTLRSHAESATALIKDITGPANGGLGVK